MNSILLAPSEESILIKIFNLSPNTLKYYFSKIIGKLGDLPNQIRETVAREIIR